MASLRIRVLSNLTRNLQKPGWTVTTPSGVRNTGDNVFRQQTRNLDATRCTLRGNNRTHDRSVVKRAAVRASRSGSGIGYQPDIHAIADVDSPEHDSVTAREPVCRESR